MTDTDDCRFCELDQREPLLHSGVVSDSVPSVGSFVEGWTLVVPRRHVFATAELGPADADDFAADLERVHCEVESRFGPAVRFEHGSAGSARLAGCGVDHAHIHIVPIDLDLRDAIHDVASTTGAFEWLPVTRAVARPGMDYIHIVDRTGSWISYSPAQPSQVVRRAIASRLRIAAWDWKSDARSDISAATRARFAA